MDRESSGQRKLRASILISVCLAVVAIVLANAKGFKDQWDVWKAKGYVEKAKQFADNKDFTMAIHHAQEAMRQAPEYEPGVRLNAQLLTAIGRSEALVYWGLLERQGTASLDDMKGKVRALLRINRPREARDLLMKLLQDHPDDKDLPALAEEVMGKDGANTAVLDMLKKHAAGEPDNRENALRLALAQLRSYDSKEVAAGREGLWKLVEGEDEISHTSLRTLSEMPRLEVEERKRLSTLLDGHALADGDDHLAALSMRLLLEPARRNQLIDDTTTRWFHGKKGNELVPLIRWLVRNNEPSRVITLVNVAEVKTRSDDRLILLNYLNALFMLQRFDELRALVDDESIPLAHGERSYFRAHLASSVTLFSNSENVAKLKSGTPASELFTAKQRDDLKQKFLVAVNALSNDGGWDQLLSLGNHLSADLNTFYEIAEDAYRAVANSGNSRLERTAVEGWLKCSRRAGNTESLRLAARRGVLRWPDDPRFTEELLYCDFLQGNRVESSLAKANQLLQASPADGVRKIIAALGFWRLGDIENAVASCQEINLRGRDINDGQMVVFASIFLEAGPLLTTAGNQDVFISQLQSIISPISARASLLSEESAMLERVRAELARMQGKAALAH